MSGGIILTTSSEALGDQLVASEGLVSQAFDRVLCGASNNWSTQALRATKVPVVPGMSISTLYWMQITAGSAITLFRGALYDSAFALVASSASNTSAPNVTNDFASISLSAAYVVPDGVTFLYAGLLPVGGTLGSYATPAPFVNAAFSATFGTASRRNWVMVGQSDLPSTATPATSTAPVWIGLA